MAIHELRRRLGSVVAIASGVLVVWVACTASARATKSVWSGVYTTAQAARGNTLYDRVCAECHGDDLDGREKAPALAGPAFAQKWDGATLKQLFERVREMPPDKPEQRLQPAQCADVLAFLLSADEIPAGAQPLVPDKDALAAIVYTSRPK